MANHSATAQTKRTWYMSVSREVTRGFVGGGSTVPASNPPDLLSSREVSAIVVQRERGKSPGSKVTALAAHA